MPFYLLIGLLHEEARLTASRIRLVSEKKLKRIQQAKFTSLQAKILDLWDDFVNQKKKMQSSFSGNALICMGHRKHSLNAQVKAMNG